jgi:GalNAc-alpha-(1->4)-GalNAc-alpha-(1->3)-diNAcBac-PP-undecaprenol alpha-1,4-N-acetyl-D-galactosaminyltransferase
LEDRVQLTGFIENVWDEYSNSALFVLSSNYEGFPNVILEAMANSTPVVSSDCPSGPKEIILHGINGFLFKVGDIDGLAKCIKHTISTETAISSIKHRAYLSVKAYCVTNIVNKYENIFQPNN